MQNILWEVAFVLVTVARQMKARCFEREQVTRMKDFEKSRMFRAAVIGLCSAGLVMSAAVAQQETAPPPPPDQQQGAPADGQMQGPMQGQRGMMDPERRVEMMHRRLGLSDDQTAQVRKILTETQAQAETLRTNSSLGPADRHAQMMSLREGEQARLRAVLTPDQQAKYEAMQAKMRERRAEGGGQGAPVPPPPPAPQS